MSAVEIFERAGVLEPLDRQLGRFFAVGSGPHTETVELLVGWLSRCLREGHVCLSLFDVAGQARVSDAGEPLPAFPEIDACFEALRQCPAVTTSGATERKPLVLDEKGRFYFHRYFEHEVRLAAALLELDVEPAREAALTGSPADTERFDVDAALSRHFPGAPPEDGQRRAAASALERRFLVISGGPGTGKTSTVVKILALFVERALGSGRRPPEILLLAPTGKAAARLGESIDQARAGLSTSSEVIEQVRAATSTIHRALGVRPDSGTRFVRHRDNPLPADIVLVDEASMIDLALMRHLVEALRPGARLLLLGDRHQLASVEAGSVLAELSEARAEGGGLAELTKSYRFKNDSAIFRLAQAIREGDAEGVAAQLDARSSEPSEVLLQRAAEFPADSKWLEQRVIAGFRPLLRERSPEAALARLEQFRVLAAHRRGPRGVETLNELCRSWLVRAALVPPSGEFYRGRQILVTENDPGTRLSNGDLGLVWTDVDGTPSVYFPSAEGPRRFSPAQLPAHETAFALTIHKTQGSEYDEVLVVLPEEGSLLLSRELLYTAVTRARKRVALFGSTDAVVGGVRRRVRRASGLAERLIASSR